MNKRILLKLVAILTLSIQPTINSLSKYVQDSS